jgi:hypothetical protein
VAWADGAIDAKEEQAILDRAEAQARLLDELTARLSRLESKGVAAGR